MSGYSSMASSDLSRRLIYSIVDGDASDDFTVDYNTGVISVINSLDYEITPTYQLVIFKIIICENSLLASLCMFLNLFI